MPISAPPPSWASIKNKPSTVSGFGITDMGLQSVANATNATNVPWTGVSSKPTTVSGLGLSDFNASAIAAQGAATFGSVGTMVLGQAGAVNVNATLAGSAINKFNGSGWVSMGLGGTWKNLGYTDVGASTLLFIRIA